MWSSAGSNRKFLRCGCRCKSLDNYDLRIKNREFYFLVYRVCTSNRKPNSSEPSQFMACTVHWNPRSSSHLSLQGASPSTPTRKDSEITIDNSQFITIQ